MKEKSKDVIAKKQPDGLGFYIHVPFCVSKCSYCDFLSFSVCFTRQENQEIIKRYVDALCTEITMLPNIETEVDSIFFGGGTPSLLLGDHVEEILSCLRSRYSIKQDAEITLECNPGTINNEKLGKYRKSGVNRLSFGVQSLDDSVLKAISRIHCAEDFWYSLQLARDHGFTNINADVIVGLPGQTEHSLFSTLHQLLAQQLPHISLYALILEEGTLLEREVSQGRVTLPDEDSTLFMQRAAIDQLEKAGLRRYEISNFASEGHYCRHNLNTWHMGAYLAAGLGASSALYLENGKLLRQKNESDPQKYLCAIKNNQATISERERVGREEQMFETVMLGLRLTQGVSNAAFKKNFGMNLLDVYSSAIYRYQKKGWLYWNGETLAMTESGLEWQNYVLLDFMNSREGC